MQEVLRQAKSTENPIMVLIDGDWFTVRWVQGADTGGPYHAEGFADENNMLASEDCFEDARWSKDGEAEWISSNAERMIEREEHERERKEAALADERRARKEQRERNRRELEDRYEQRFGPLQERMTMQNMRKALREDDMRKAIEIDMKFDWASLLNI